MQGRRVVVTGLGIVSPLGSGCDLVWQRLNEGHSGVTRIDRFDPAEQDCKIAAQVADFVDAKIFEPRHARRADRFIRYAIAASEEAISHSGFNVSSGFDATRAGVLIGSGIGGMPLIEAGHSILLDKGPKRVSPFFIPSAIINQAAGWVAMLFNLRGPNLAVVTACTTGLHCVGDAARLIAYGDADVMIAGGSESTITRLTVAGFASARALSCNNDDPAGASRPFDQRRNGFVLGEGAGVLVLEEYEQAKMRGAKIYCEVAGYGMSCDAHHITAPPPDGEGAQRSMENSLRDASLSASDIDHINAHGTSTELGDKAETCAIRTVFGSHADHIAISATKSMTGHLLGAAGGIEAVFSALAIANSCVPPTINLNHPDPECDLDYVAGLQGRQMEVNAAMTNSFGFGGTNGSLVLTRV